jgi:hypothetical protein
MRKPSRDRPPSQAFAKVADDLEKNLRRYGTLALTPGFTRLIWGAAAAPHARVFEWGE